MDESRRTNRRKSYFKGLRQVSLPLSLCCSPGFLLGLIALSNSKMAFCSWEPTYYSLSSSREEKRRASLQLASGLTLTGVAWAFCLLGLIPSSSRYRQPWTICPFLESERCIHPAFIDCIHFRTFIKEHWQVKIHQDQNRQTKNRTPWPPWTYKWEHIQVLDAKV